MHKQANILTEFEAHPERSRRCTLFLCSPGWGLGVVWWLNSFVQHWTGSLIIEV